MDQILALERQLLDPAIRADRQVLERLLAEDFEEIGRSGRRYDRASCIAGLIADPSPSDSLVLSDVRLRALSETTILLTYSATGLRGGKTTLRSSLWVHRAAGWQLAFHQGTGV